MARTTHPRYQPNHKPWPEDVVEVRATEGDLRPNEVCCICLRKIKVQIWKNSGICSEQCRKDRDNDHEPFQPVNLRIHEGEDK